MSSIYDKSNLPSPIIIRPTGIWNSRSPFHSFLQIYKANSRSYELTRMCIEKAKRDMREAKGAGLELEQFLGKASDISRRAWKNYVKSIIKRDQEGNPQNPMYGNLKHDLIMSERAVRFSTFISSMTLFEGYMNCWLVNYLLAKLEADLPLNKAEREFARQISPVHGQGSPPNIAKILTSIPLIKECLGTSKDGNQSENGASSTCIKSWGQEFTLMDRIFFWLQHRNCIIHNGGICTPRFYDNYYSFWQCSMSDMHKDDFKKRFPLTMSIELLHQCRFDTYKAARSLDRSLCQMSLSRRGHPWAPNPPPNEDIMPPKDAPELLLDGDHFISLKWHVDDDFRNGFLILE
jgi:hypothetical protein